MKKRGVRGLSILLSLLLLVSAVCFNMNYVFAEDEVPGGATELARGKAAVATHDQEGNGVASYANDGDFSTKWSTYGYNNVVPVALQIDLGLQYDVTRLGMSWYGSGRIFNYNVYITDEAIVEGETATTDNLTPVVTGQGIGSAQQAEACEYIDLPQAAAGRYVTVVVTSLEGMAAFVALAELEIWGAESLPDDLVELAQNKNVTASFSQEICPPENAVDGDVGTRWSSYGSEMPQALMIDMDAIVSVGYLNLLIFQQNRITDYEIYLTQTPLVVGDQLELGDAQPIGAIRGEGVGDGNTSPEDWTGLTVCRTDFSVTGRYLTIVGVAATSGTAAGLWEVEAYGEVKGPVVRNILSVSSVPSATVEVNASNIESLLPQTVRVSLEDDRSALLPVTWELETIRLDTPGEYTVRGILDCSAREDISNPSELTATITILVQDSRQEAVDALKALIAAIGDVTQDNYKDKLSAIENAEQALNALIEELGAQVEGDIENLDALRTARERYDNFIKSESEMVYGDLNGDTKVDASDALLVLQSSVQLISLTDAQKTAGDVDGNQKIDASDALQILQKSVGLISKFEVESK